jgi:hypothetical protein
MGSTSRLSREALPRPANVLLRIDWRAKQASDGRGRRRGRLVPGSFTDRGSKQDGMLNSRA